MRGCLAALLLCGAAPAAAAEPLRVAVVQTAIGPTLETNRNRILERLSEAEAGGARVAVFPGGALTDPGGKPNPAVAAAINAIRAAAQRHGLYVIFGGWSWSEKYARATNWAKVIDPAGVELVHYDQLSDVREAPNPPVFSLDGVAASTIICADRWLRAVEELPIQQGARLSFELSNDYDSEWVPELEWYWYVPRALRNNAYVFFVNTANRYPGRPEPGADPRPRHGHSAVIAPDGSILTAESGDMETILYVDVDPEGATRAGALERRKHALLGKFWEEGLALLKRPRAPEGTFRPLDCPKTELSVGVAQADSGGWAQLERLLEERRERVDLLAVAAAPPSPEAAAALARERQMTLVYLDDSHAFVLGPDGRILARHRGLAEGGAEPATMWFRVKGVPAVVTVGRDALWNEIAELAAFAGARLHLHLTNERAPNRAAQLRRRQIGAALSSFFTLTLMAAPAYSAVWEDLAGEEETRAALRGEPGPEGAPVQIYSPFSANLVAEAGGGSELIVVRRLIPGPNPHVQRRISRFQPAMETWYRSGARLLCPLLELKRE